MSTASNEPSMKLQIVVDKKKNRVLYAEAYKEFVDFMFHILSFPLAAIHRILAKNTSSTFGPSISTLLEGLKKLDVKYIEDPAKDYILNLKAPFWGKNTTKLLPEASWGRTRSFLKKPHIKDFSGYVELYSGETFFKDLDYPDLEVEGTKMDIVLAQGNEKGYVKEAVTFFVMDDLVVRPAEPDTVISMYEQIIKDNVATEKREVTFGTAEAIKMIKASMISTTVLTDVFLSGAVKAEN